MSDFVYSIQVYIYFENRRSNPYSETCRSQEVEEDGGVEGGAQGPREVVEVAGWTEG